MTWSVEHVHPAEVFSPLLLGKLGQSNWQWNDRLPNLTPEDINSLQSNTSEEDRLLIKIVGEAFIFIGMDFRFRPAEDGKWTGDGARLLNTFMSVAMWGYQLGRAALLRDLDQPSRRIDLDRLTAKCLVGAFCNVDALTSILHIELRKRRELLVRGLVSTFDKSTVPTTEETAMVEWIFDIGMTIALLDDDYQRMSHSWLAKIEASMDSLVRSPESRLLTYCKELERLRNDAAANSGVKHSEHWSHVLRPLAALVE